ncbi:hypothetical protein Cflav_PD0908 [Pedosphaera parvula Ellin514]|uniref:Uncharacterized protein n=2 Tax=Pedosphaera TaxID=1032526 RepID=B9XQV1_PEDPL|nr:hypothetical protein Cflav_PD0908 [Pedosphaera parvula Ellin514]
MSRGDVDFLALLTKAQNTSALEQRLTGSDYIKAPGNCPPIFELNTAFNLGKVAYVTSVSPQQKRVAHQGIGPKGKTVWRGSLSVIYTI